MSSTIKDTTAGDLLVDNTAEKQNLAGYAQKSLVTHLIMLLDEGMQLTDTATVTVTAGGIFEVSENDGGGVSASATAIEADFFSVGETQ